MNFTEALPLAQKGDKEAFDTVYGSVCRDLYKIAYYTLKSRTDIIPSVANAAQTAMKHCGECKNQPGFKAYCVRLLCEQIISCYKEYRRNNTPAEPTSDGLRQQFMRLTDAERLTAAIWAICGYNTKQLSIVTGLEESAAAEKLAAAQRKLENSVIIF